VNVAGDHIPGPEEHRLALVMNGGVSLAVWMGGVAHEIDNLRRASHRFPQPEGCDPQEAAVLDLWGKFCAEHGTRVTVDVIGGTSAGGLNGVLLATAIARGMPLTGLRELWKKSAQLSADALLTPQQGGAASVLNGDFFLGKIQQALQAIGPADTGQGRDVTLTVTATSLTGDGRELHDTAGESFTEADHRRRYEFRRVRRPVTYEQGPDGGPPHFTPQPLRSDFDDGEPVALAARSSASYPVAFAPVPEKDCLRHFRSWPPWSTGSAREWLADGGILDNSPFQHVLDAVAKQSVSATWRRTVCYVVPSATEAQLGRDLTPPSVAGGETLSPPWTSVVSSAIGLPRESDFRDDMEMLGAQIRSGRSTLNVDRFEDMIAPGAAGSLARTMAAASSLLPYYREARAAAATYETADLVNAAPGRGGFLDPAHRADVTPVTSTAQLWLPDSMPAGMPATWEWGLAAAERILRLLLRAVRSKETVPDGTRAAIDEAVHKVVAVRKAVAKKLSDYQPPTAPWQPTAAAAAKLINEVYDELEVPAALHDLVTSAADAFASAMPGVAALTAVQAGLCLEVLDGASGLPADFRPSPVFEFLRFGISQMPDMLAPPNPPADGKDILYGTRLSHFAAFVRPEWREWDWMWGRVHAAVHLGQLLGLSAGQVDEMVIAILAAEGWTAGEVRTQAEEVLKLTTADIYAQLRADDTVRLALDAVFALLNSGRRTSPKVPDAVASAGKWISALVAAHPGKVGPVRRLVRIPAWPARVLVWLKTRKT